MRRAASRQPQNAKPSSGDESDGPSCSACKDGGPRVMVTCAACAHHFHLSCAKPPLRRRPALESAWRCGSCAGADASPPPSSAKTTAKSKAPRKRASGRVSEEEDALPRKSRRVAVATAAAAAVPAAVSAAVPAAVPAGKQKAAATGKAAKQNQKTQLKQKQQKQQKQQQKKKLEAADADDSEEEEADDDADSDFTGDGSASEDDDEDEEDDDDDDARDDEFERPKKKKLPTLKTPPAKKKVRATPPAASSAGRNASTKREPTTGGAMAPNSGYDSMELAANDGDDNEEDEAEDEAEPYAGPTYFIEYGPNNRARCKQCEEKLAKGTLRIGVHVKHSIFGLTTYFKHLTCTQICLSTAATLAAKERAAAVAATAESGKAPVMDVELDAPLAKVEPIRGFSSLQKSDQEAVRAHMAAVEAQQLLDERLEITEDHYNKKTRMPEKEPSPLLTVPLLPYQREALAWMTAQEQSAYRGGILADEMGMGKTIQAIALILENVRQEKRAQDVGSLARKKRAGASDQPLPRGGTLVVCPVVAVMQWKSEIERFVERGRLSVYVHHGPKRLTSPEKIAAYDIVLTTYSIIENEIRKTLAGDKVACKYCKKKFFPAKLVLHNKYFCGPNAQKTARQDKQQSNKAKRKKAAGEESESEDDAYPKKPAPKAKAGGGVRGRKPAPRKVVEIDDSEDDEPRAPKKVTASKSPLHQVSWTRIVLDEAHYIKDRRNNTARGVFELQSEYKWCLTGTPLQNRIGELFSLVRFLQIKSYAYYHCTNCECQLLDFHFPNGKCELCEHTALQHYSFFNKKIVIPIQAYGYVAEGKIAMLRLQNEVLQHILLRRTKEGRADDICLPPKLVRIRKDHLDERENDFYEAIYTQSQAQFNTYVSSGTLLNNYAHIFDLLIRLRQAVDHPYLVIFSKSNPALQLPAAAGANLRPVVEEKPLLVAQEEGDNAKDDRVSGDEGLCTICHEDVEDPVAAKCGHEFCRECVKEFIESLPMGADATCPSCAQLLTVELEPKAQELDDVHEQWDNDNAENAKTGAKYKQQVDLSQYHKTSILHRISDMQSFQTSTKVEALMQELELMRQRDPSGKAIIFSQFVNMLDIIQHRLQLGGIKCVKMSGNMSMDVRDRTIKAFREDSTITAFLISLKAGGVALNLTIASHIFLMDPWWNPAAESQAIDRTHRLGQFKPIQATRFIIAGTVEERILKLQEKKRLIFEGTVGASVSAVCRLTAEDLRFLFSK